MHLCAIWLLASRTDNKIPWDPEWIAKRINATSKVDLTSLQAAGFIELIGGASNTLATRKQSALSETEQRERQRAEAEESQSRGEAETRVLAAKNGKPRAAPERSITRSILGHWNTLDALTSHRALTEKTATSINARLKAGYSEADLCKAITRYAELCQQSAAPGYNRWSLAALMSREEGGWIDKMLDPKYDGITHETANDRRRKRNAEILDVDPEVPRVDGGDPL